MLLALIVGGGLLLAKARGKARQGESTVGQETEAQATGPIQGHGYYEPIGEHTEEKPFVYDDKEAEEAKAAEMEAFEREKDEMEASAEPGLQIPITIQNTPPPVTVLSTPIKDATLNTAQTGKEYTSIVSIFSAVPVVTSVTRTTTTTVKR